MNKIVSFLVIIVLMSACSSESDEILVCKDFDQELLSFLSGFSEQVASFPQEYKGERILLFKKELKDLIVKGELCERKIITNENVEHQELLEVISELRLLHINFQMLDESIVSGNKVKDRVWMVEESVDGLNTSFKRMREQKEGQP